MITRRSFIQGVAGSTVCIAHGLDRRRVSADSAKGNLVVAKPSPDEDVFQYILRHCGAHDRQLYARILGAANEFKEGDESAGLAAANDESRSNARLLLANARLVDIDAHSPHQDGLFKFIAPTRHQPGQHAQAQTLSQLKHFLLDRDEQSIKQIMPTLSSDVIACVVKLMSNDELIQMGRKVFNPLPGSQIGAKGYLGARLQPNSPTDHVDDIRWQVFDGWSYAVGDVLLGTNPVSSDPASVAAIERALQDLLTTFKIDHLMPHCVLAHIDIQAEVEQATPGLTALWFQSIAGCDAANQTFDISVDKMRRYASSRSGQYGLYFETGQGADFTNGHSQGFDMVVHESRKYGFARALTGLVADAQSSAGKPARPWVHLNDVAGFIGPEVFRTREQLVRCCLEDIVMGKLHGLCIGLDVCSTLHMDVSLADLDWCLDQIMPANPAYLMALPTKIDPMLGYLTTGFQDHVRLRERFKYRVNDAIWTFFQELGVIDSNGQPTDHFGDPVWVFLQYCRRQGDPRSDAAILEEGRRQLAQVRGRGLFIAQRHGDRPWDLLPSLASDIDRIYDDAKLSIWAELDQEFVDAIPDGLELATLATDRTDYILHPTSGERPNASSNMALHRLRQRHNGNFNVQIVISDGLNALAIMEQGHLAPFLETLRRGLSDHGMHVAPENLIVNSGRVRAGYRIGEILFADLPKPRAILHVIGERPGTGHRTFSTYITSVTGDVWSRQGTVDHNLTKVVSGIASTALKPTLGADKVVRLLTALIRS